MGKARRTPFFEVINAPKRDRPGTSGLGVPGLGGRVPAPPPPQADRGDSGPTHAPTHQPPAHPDTAHRTPAADPRSAGTAKAGRSDAALEEPKPVQRTEIAPSTTPLPSPNSSQPGQKVVSVSMNAVLIGVTVVLVVLVGVYAIGFQRGKSTADTPILTGDLGGVSPTPPAPIRDPIAVPGRLTPGEGRAPQGPGTVGGPQTEPVRPSSVAGQVLGTDPRQADTNYFELDVLPYRDAEEAVRFLTANGLPAAAVPQRGVDVADARAKNRPCIVFLLEGIPSTLYRGPEGQQVRQRIEPEVRRLGQLWRTQHRGASTFAQAYWRKHQPGR